MVFGSNGYGESASLLFADDVVLMASSACDLPLSLDMFTVIWLCNGMGPNCHEVITN